MDRGTDGLQSMGSERGRLIGFHLHMPYSYFPNLQGVVTYLLYIHFLESKAVNNSKKIKNVLNCSR